MGEQKQSFHNLLSTHGADTTTANLASATTRKKTKQMLTDTTKDTGGNPKLVKKALAVDTVASPLKCVEPSNKRAKCEQVDTTRETQIKKRHHH